MTTGSAAKVVTVAVGITAVRERHGARHRTGVPGSRWHRARGCHGASSTAAAGAASARANHAGQDAWSASPNVCIAGVAVAFHDCHQLRGKVVQRRWQPEGGERKLPVLGCARGTLPYELTCLPRTGVHVSNGRARWTGPGPRAALRSAGPWALRTTYSDKIACRLLGAPSTTRKSAAPSSASVAAVRCRCCCASQWCTRRATSSEVTNGRASAAAMSRVCCPLPPLHSACLLLVGQAPLSLRRVLSARRVCVACASRARRALSNTASLVASRCFASLPLFCSSPFLFSLLFSFH